MQKKRLSFAVGVLLSLITFLSFREALRCTFITAFDDALYVTENTHIASGLSFNSFLWALQSGYASNWHPLTWVSHMLDVEIFGLDPAGHHLTSLFLHLSNTLLLFTLFIRCTGRLWESAAVALLFAVHPGHVESVVWVAERKDVLSTFFAFLSLHSYLIFTDSKKAGVYLWTLFLFSCALMSKPMVVTLPFIMLLIDFWPLDRLGSIARIKTACIEKIPFLLLSVFSSIITILVQRDAGALVLSENLSTLERFSHSFSSYLNYLYLLIWPLPLSVYYPFPEQVSLIHGVLSFFTLFFVTLFFFFRVPGQKYLFTGWAWFLITLFPVIGFVQAGAQAMADRYTYIPSVGIFVLAVFGGAGLLRRVPKIRPLLVTVGCMVSIFFVVLTTRQVPLWIDSITLFEHASRVTKKNIHAHHNLGAAYAAEGRTDDAIHQYKKVLEIRPGDSLAHHNLGLALLKKNDLSSGVQHFKEALKEDPGQFLTHYNLALALIEMNVLDKAVFHLKKTIELKPDYMEAYFRLGVIEQRREEFSKAAEYFSRVLMVAPQFSEAHINLGNILEDVYGDTDKAYVHYQSALESSPDYPEAHNSMGILLAKKGLFKEARKHFERAVELRPEYDDARRNLSRVSGAERLR